MIFGAKQHARRMTTVGCLALTIFVLSAPPATGWAAQRIAVLDFELNDLTLLPNSPEDMERTASIRPLLEKELTRTANLDIVSIDSAEIHAANKGFGYLFEHADLAAELGKQHGADWLVVGRLHKPTHLFAYLMVHLVDTRTATLAENIIVEVKGQQDVVTKKGAARLAKKIARHIATKQP